LAVLKRGGCKLFVSIASSLLYSLAGSSFHGWRANAKLAKEVHLSGLLAALAERSNGASKAAAVKQVQQSFQRLVRGDTAGRIRIWQDAQRTAHAAGQVALMESKSAGREVERERVATETGRLGAMRSLERVMGGMLKGALGGAVVVWNHEMKRSAVLDYMRLQGKQEAQNGAIKQCQLILGGLLRGLLLVAVLAWKRKLTDHRLHSLKAILSGGSEMMQKNFALKRLSQTLHTMLKGRQARAMFNFYQNCVHSGELSQQEIPPLL